MSPLVRKYMRYIERHLFPLQAKGFVIWGSTGNNSFTAKSDLDLWIITQERLSFEQAHALSEQERMLRETFALSHNLPEFARHRASIFSEAEATAYLSAFYWRYYTSLKWYHAAIALNYDIPTISMDSDLILEDLVATMQERCERYSISGKTKLLGYNLRDYIFHTTGAIVPPSSSMEQIGEQSSETATFIDTHARHPGLHIATRRQTHALFWTLEKVRWELHNAFQNPTYFQKWKTGTHNGFGYSLPALGNFLFQLIHSQRCRITADIKELGKHLTMLLHEQDTNSIPLIYELLSSLYTLDHHTPHTDHAQSYSVTLPILRNNTIHICKISHHQRYIIAEYEGQKRFLPEQPVELSVGTVSYIVSPLLPGTPHQNERPDAVADALRNIHRIPGTYFGRIDGAHFPTYAAYLHHRITQLPNIPSKPLLLYLLELLSPKLRDIPPVACHMDPNPSNVLFLQAGKAILIDWEHFSYCAAAWDIERAIISYTPEQQEHFRKTYYTGKAYDAHIALFTRAVVMTTFASKLQDISIQTQLYLSAHTLLHELYTSLSAHVPTGRYSHLPEPALQAN